MSFVDPKIVMSKNLVIVESPAKAKTIEGYLGKDFKVASSMGHIRDLPKGGDAIDIENDFEPTYEISPDKKDVIEKLKKLAKEAEMVYLASDEDREGEAISWHLKEALDLKDKKNAQDCIHRDNEESHTECTGEPPGHRYRPGECATSQACARPVGRIRIVSDTLEENKDWSVGGQSAICCRTPGGRTRAGDNRF